MKRNLMLLLVSALLVYSLTACGCAARDTGTTQNNPTAETVQPDGGLPNQNTADGTDGANTGDGNTIGSGNSMTENPGDTIRDDLNDAGNAIENGVNDAADAITGNDRAPSDGGVAIDDMLRNGRVRDNVR